MRKKDVLHPVVCFAILGCSFALVLGQGISKTGLSPVAGPPAFDVVSIKLNRSGSPAMIDRTPPNGYVVENMPVRIIVSDAFGIRPDLISGGPGWLDSEHYDVIAKVAGDDVVAYHALSREQRNGMLQAVLADRFQLSVHRVSKQLSGYVLTVSKSGFKLQPVAADKRGGWGANLGDIRAEGTAISTLCTLLSEQLQQTVVDQTGLAGLYTFHLQWSPDRLRTAASADAGASEPSGLAALPTALEEQLGLKLTPAKLPTTTLVVDRIERPSEN